MRTSLENHGIAFTLAMGLIFAGYLLPDIGGFVLAAICLFTAAVLVEYLTTE